MRPVVVLFLAGISCSEGRPPPEKLASEVQGCTADCNGRLPSRNCADLDPSRYRGGTAYCSADCSIDLRDCIPLATSGCNPVGPNTCPPGQVCVQVGTGLTEGTCVDEQPGPECQNGVTRCSGQILQSCVGGQWQTTRDCAASGQTCGAGQTGFACQAPTSCTSGATRCSANAVQTCTGGSWTNTTPCGASATCTASGNGHSCQANGGACTFNGHTGTVRPLLFDRLAAVYYKIATTFVAISVETPATDPTEKILIELYPDLGAPTTVPSTIDLAQHASYESCTVCVVGFRGLGGTERRFMPSSGTLELTAYPGEVGQPLSVTVRNLTMREVTIDDTTLATTDVAGGGTWCTGSSVTWGGSSERYGCNQPGEGSCVNGQQLVRCDNRVLSTQSCSTNQVCRESAQGVASCGAPSTACDIAGHWDWDVFTFHDRDVWRYQTLMSMAFNPGEVIFTENYPDKGGRLTPGVVQLTGDQTDPDKCSTCVYARLDGAYFMARYGVAEITDMPTNPGDLFAVSLRQLELHQVTDDFFEVADGATWCIPNIALGAFSTRYPCLGGGPGDRSCAYDRLAQCDANSEMVLVQDCAASGDVCAVTGPGTAACQ